MADQGPLVRVDTDGKGNLLKLTRREADAYVATHTGAKIVATPPRGEIQIPEGLHIEGEAKGDGGPYGLLHMSRKELQAFARQEDLDATGTADVLRKRLGEHLASKPVEADTAPGTAPDANANANANDGANTSENSPEA